MRWVLRPWKQAFDFNGRATRREYWLFILQIYAVIFAFFFLASLLTGSSDTGAGLLMIPFTILAIFLFIAGLSVGVRRIHDHDKSGWLILIGAIPLIGWILHLILMLTPPTPGENSYGHDPREGDHIHPDALAGVFS